MDKDIVSGLIEFPDVTELFFGKYVFSRGTNGVHIIMPLHLHMVRWFKLFDEM